MPKKISKTAYKQTFNPEPLRRCWKECLEKSSFYARKRDAEEFNKNNYWKKRGLAVVPMKYCIALPVAFYNQVSLGEMSLEIWGQISSPCKNWREQEDPFPSCLTS